MNTLPVQAQLLSPPAMAEAEGRLAADYPRRALSRWAGDAIRSLFPRVFAANVNAQWIAEFRFGRLQLVAESPVLVPGSWSTTG